MDTSEEIRTFEDAQAIFAENLPGYTRRPLQIELAGAIEQAMAEDRIILAQAGTGIGKSLAGLVPAAYSGKRTVVATSTKALQGQYSGKDLPFLEHNLDTEVTWAVIKGRSNYPCAMKIDELKHPSVAQQQVLSFLEASDKDILDREDLPNTSAAEWAQLSITPAECPGAKDCPFAREGQCYAENAKVKAAESQIVITNTAYLATDLMIRAASDGAVQLLGDFDQLVIDEAHNLEAAITSALEDKIGLKGLIRVAHEADGHLMMEGGDLYGEQVEQAAQALWDKLALRWEWHLEQTKGKADPMRLRQANIIQGMRDELITLIDTLNLLGTAVRETRPEDRKAKLARVRLMRRIGDWASRLRYYGLASDAEIARWVSEETSTYKGREEKRLFLNQAPVSVAPWLQENVWGEDKAVVLMSATLAVGGKFGYVRERLGLPEDAVEYIAGSPFDYPSQARLYIPEESVPAPSGASQMAWRGFAAEAAGALTEAAGGGALLLFTSRSAMEDSYSRLAGRFEARGLRVLKQGDLPNNQLARIFREDEDSVLFALRSFFEGFDVAGRSLRLVVLDKLPFSVPTDVLVAARQEACEARYGRGSSFGKMAIPEMSLVLIQAFGRLIRHISDKGVVAVLDSRLTGKGYGKRILASLPPAPQTTSIQAAMEFLREG